MMKTYTNILLAAVCVIVGICAAIITWAQPINGDLTRIGAYPERWFGWTEPQERIPDMANTNRTAGKRHILVIGDSFSEAGRWQAALNEHYSFEFVHARKMRLAKLGERIARDKPDAVVIESVERFTLAMFGKESQFMGQTTDRCTASDAPTAGAAPALLPTGSTSDPVFPFYSRKTLPSSGKDISQGFHILKLWVDFLRKPKKRKVVLLDLTTADLFSNARSKQLLVIQDDLLLNQAEVEDNLPTAKCSIQKAADILAGTGVAYTFLFVPDKTTAYQNYLTRDDIRQQPAPIDLITASNVPHTINMLAATRSRLTAGEKDFYLPNDTHWGYKGFRLAASLIDAELQSQWPATAVSSQD